MDAVAVGDLLPSGNVALRDEYHLLREQNQMLLEFLEVETDKLNLNLTD